MPLYYTAGQKVRASDINAGPFEWVLGGQYRTTGTGFITTETVVLTTPSVVIPAYMTVAVELDAVWYSSVASDQAKFRIRQTNLTGFLMGNPGGVASYPIPFGGTTAYQCNFKVFQTAGTSPVTINFVATCERAVGTGNLQVVMNSSLIIKQLGGQTSSPITTV